MKMPIQEYNAYVYSFAKISAFVLEETEVILVLQVELNLRFLAPSRRVRTDSVICCQRWGKQRTEGAGVLTNAERPEAVPVDGRLCRGHLCKEYGVTEHEVDHRLKFWGSCKTVYHGRYSYFYLLLRYI